MDHSKTKTNGICARFHGTIKDEVHGIALRKRLYRSVEEGQTDLDAWLAKDNKLRPHSGNTAMAKAKHRCGPSAKRHTSPQTKPSGTRPSGLPSRRTVNKTSSENHTETSLRSRLRLYNLGCLVRAVVVSHDRFEGEIEALSHHSFPRLCRGWHPQLRPRLQPLTSPTICARRGCGKGCHPVLRYNLSREP